jgi:ankyrin repeat protein
LANFAQQRCKKLIERKDYARAVMFAREQAEEARGVGDVSQIATWAHLLAEAGAGDGNPYYQAWLGHTPQGPDPDALGNWSESSALMGAAAGGHAELVVALLERGATVYNVVNDGQTALMAAAGENRTAVVDVLLRHGAGLEMCDAQWRTALHHAVASGQPECAEHLLEVGADPLACTEEGLAALHLAVEACSPVLVRRLAASTGVDLRTSDGLTSLMFAVRRLDFAMVELLLELGADPEARDSAGGGILRYADQGKFSVTSAEDGYSDDDWEEYERSCAATRLKSEAMLARLRPLVSSTP